MGMKAPNREPALDIADNLTDEELLEALDTRDPYPAWGDETESLKGRENLPQWEAGGRFRLLTDADLAALPPPTYLIDGVLPATGNAMLYGPSGVGKSFLALDWALSIATGRNQWRGRRVRSGFVVYVAAEGTYGLNVRRQAWGIANGYKGAAGIRYVCDAVQLLDLMDAHALAAAVAAESPEPPALIVLDTLARCMVGGDENSVKDVSRAIASTDLLRRLTGALVLLVHHSQKQGDLERGSSALRGAQDVMLCLRSNKAGDLALNSTKVKDGPALEGVRLRLHPTGKSCVIVSAKVDPTASGLTGAQRECLRALGRAAKGGGASASTWLRSTAIPERSFYRLIKQLGEGGYVEERTRVGYALTQLGETELLSPANDCQHTAIAARRPNDTRCHAPVGGGREHGNGVHRAKDELKRETRHSEGDS